MKILVTGSSGLIGSEAVLHFESAGHEVTGIDNNMRREFFGPGGDTRWNLERLLAQTKRFKHLDLDIRDRDGIFSLFKSSPFDLIIHCAAQPSHDKAREIPLVDFDVNAVGTLNLLEATRQACPEAVFIHMSTNKVYGDAPNELPLTESETRYDYANPEDFHGIDETCRIDRSLHSLFGASKVAADVVAQEYGQVRDQIHSYDVIKAFEAFWQNPRPGEVYNIGGGRDNSASVLESIKLVEELSGKKMKWTYVEQNRIGDHICYISDLRKLRSHFPEWNITRTLTDIGTEIVAAHRELGRQKGA